MGRQSVAVQKRATYTGHRDGIYALAPAKDKEHFFSGAADGQVVQWSLQNPEQGKLLAQLNSSVYALCYLPERQLLIVGHNFNGLQVLHTGTLALAHTIKLPPVRVFAIHHNPVLGRLYIALGNGLLLMLNDQDFTLLAQKQLSQQNIRCLALHPSGMQLAAGSSENKIYILNADTLSVEQEIDIHLNSVFALAYSTKGDMLLSGGRDAHLRILNTETGYQVQETIIAHLYTINTICYSPCGQYFATGSKDKTIKIWNASSLQLLKVIDKARHEGHSSSVNNLFWTGRQNELVSCSDDRTILVWELNFGLRYENNAIRDQTENL